ncbi:hypothetical protein SLA2020_483640 [Shorea laevis]
MESTRVRAGGAAIRDGSGSRRWLGHRRQEHGQRAAGEGFDPRFLGQVVTYFFYNFPEDLQAKDLWQRFRVYGRVVDVFLPARRDKWGKRFGFVRMAGVQEIPNMERRLNEIWFNSYKLRVKLADNWRQRRSGNRMGNDRVRRITHQGLVQSGKSYVQAVAGNTSKVGDGNEREMLDEVKERNENTVNMVSTNQVRYVENGMNDVGAMKGMDRRDKGEQSGEEIIEFFPEKEEIQWLEGGMVAVVRTMALITGIQERIDADGGMITLSPLGGRSVLLTERSQGYLSEYMEQNKDVFDL